MKLRGRWEVSIVCLTTLTYTLTLASSHLGNKPLRGVRGHVLYSYCVAELKPLVPWVLMKDRNSVEVATSGLRSA